MGSIPCCKGEGVCNKEVLAAFFLRIVFFLSDLLLNLFHFALSAL